MQHKSDNFFLIPADVNGYDTSKQWEQQVKVSARVQGKAMSRELPPSKNLVRKLCDWSYIGPI